MRTALRLVIALVMLGLIAACAQQPAQAPAQAPAAQQPPAQQPAAKQEAPKAAAPAAATQAPAAGQAQAPAAGAKGGNLVIATTANSEPANMDAHIDPYATTWLLNSFVTDTLVTLTEKGEYQPGLAESWTVSPDGKTWELKIKSGVKFQDGTPVNAAAVKFNIDRVVDPETKSALMANYLGVKEYKGTEAPNDTTVRITYNNPVPGLLWGLSIMPVWSPDAVKKAGKDFHLAPVGTGPYKMTEWVKSSHVKFTKDPTYQGAPPMQEHTGPAYLDSIMVRFVGENAVLGEVLKTGQVNMVMELPAPAVATYKGNAAYQVVPGYQPGTGMQFMMNVSKAPFNDVKVRQALRLAYDNDQINTTLYDGNYIAVKGPLTQFTRCYWKGGETANKMDLEKAKSLLEEAGWKVNPSTRIREKDGKPLQFTMTMLHHQEMGEYLATLFRQIGADMKIEVVPGPVQLQKATSGEFDLIYQRLRDFEPDSLYSAWFTGNLRPGGWAWSRYNNPKLDEILVKTQQTGNQDERCKLFTEAQQILVNDVPALPTVDNPIYYALDKSVKGFKLGATGSRFSPRDMYIEK